MHTRVISSRKLARLRSIRENLVRVTVLENLDVLLLRVHLDGEILVRTTNPIIYNSNRDDVATVIAIDQVWLV